MSSESERREFYRVRCDIPVRYKFLAPHIQDGDLSKSFDGITNNLSGGGLLLQGTLPKLEWVPDLLMQRMAVGVTVSLPGANDPVVGLMRVAWIETINETTRQCRLGLKFREITARDRDRIFQFVIHAHVP